MRRGVAALQKLDLAHSGGIFTLSGSVGVERLATPVRGHMNGMRTTEVGPHPSRGDEFFQLLLLSKDRAHVRAGAAGQRDPTPGDIPRLSPVVGDLSRRMGISMPKAVGDAKTFAERVCHGTQPELRDGGGDRRYPALMNDEELAAIFAHELGHVKNQDILISSICCDTRPRNYLSGQMAMRFSADASAMRSR
jgi:hypothetical protein